MTHINEHKKIHMIGVGGCSMNGLALILRARGFEVTGSDSTPSPFTELMEKEGIPVTIGQRAENIGDADLVVYSAAIKPTNPERAEAARRGIPELERSVVLGQISEHYHNVVGIAGCHGKTTITSMLALISELDAMDATVHVGGFVEFLGGGTRIGRHDLFITEACEYVESFLTLHPTVALINNIDNDHLDYYKTMDNIVAAFNKFVALLPENGRLICCTDNAYVKTLFDGFDGHKLSYGMADDDYTPANAVYDENGCAEFELMKGGASLGHINLHIPGRHAVIDAMAAAAVALELGADFPTVAKALSLYRNTRRRFELYGERDGIKVYHDYAHHPAEVAAALDAASRVPHNKIHCVFQCNSYTRAKTLFLENVTCFANADEVLVPDIYPGREQDDGSVHARDMVKAINAGGGNAIYIPTFDEIRTHLDKTASSGDIVLTLGSGDVYKQTAKLL